MSGGEVVKEVRLSFVNRKVADATKSPIELAAAEIILLNPNTGTLPIFRTRRDADITLACYRRHPVLIKEDDLNGNPWSLRFGTLFHVTNDSDLFRTATELTELGASFDGWSWQRGDHRWLPLYAAKMLSHWNHRFSTYADATQAQVRAGTLPRLNTDELDNPASEPLPCYWVSETEVNRAVPEQWDRDWFIGWRAIARATDVRTFIPSVAPRVGAGNGLILAFPGDPRMAYLLQAIWSSLIFDYIARQKLSGSNMNYFTTKQLSCPSPESLSTVPAWSNSPLGLFIRCRSLELVYTSIIHGGVRLMIILV